MKDRKNKKKKQGKTNTLLASYYGLSAPDEDETKDIDSVHFRAKQYTEEMLTKEGVYSLLKIDDDMVQEIRRLDCDMQSLVYENYSKFISATDTIRLINTNEIQTNTTCSAIFKGTYVFDDVSVRNSEPHFLF